MLSLSSNGILAAFIIAFTISCDTFITSFTYGYSGIKIPIKSMYIINILGSGILGLSYVAGMLLAGFMPDKASDYLCFGILFCIGITKVLDSTIKSIIKKYSGINKQLQFSMLNLKFILQLYADPDKADLDSSKTISTVEAVSLALALSLDGAAVGFGAALGHVNGFAMVIFSLITDAAAIVLGCASGHKANRHTTLNISWVGGAVLILLAILKLF